VRAVAAGDAEWRSVPCVHAVLEGGTGGVEPTARAARAYRVAGVRRRARRGAVGCARLAATPGLGRPLLGPAVPGSLDAGGAGRCRGARAFHAGTRPRLRQGAGRARAFADLTVVAAPAFRRDRPVAGH